MFEDAIVYFPQGRIDDSDAADSTVTLTDDDVRVYIYKHISWPTYRNRMECKS